MSGKRIDRRGFMANAARTVAAVGIAGARGARAKAKRESDRPNIVFLLTDDQRWDALGCMGNPVARTPNLDALAEDGVLFENNFCTTSICMTSRASIFTGMYATTHGINDFSLPLPEDRFALSYPALLREAGYRTGFVGKWGLGGELPKKSFDFFDGFSGQGKYFPENDGEKHHLTRILCDKSLEFLRGCGGEQPFCLSVSFKAPHVQDEDPRQFLYDPELGDMYEDVRIPLPETASAAYFDALPGFIRGSEGRRRWEMRFADEEMRQKSVRGYYRLVTGVDRAAGRIRAELQRLGLDDNTVIVFTSDNGFFLGEHGLAGKWLMHEESIRTPLIIRDPRVADRLRGRRCQEMTLNIDIAPTLLELAGVSVPTTVQGRGLTSLVHRGRIGDWRAEWFYEHRFNQLATIPQSEGIRDQRWKYIRYVDRDPLYEELYDLKEDPFEKSNLASDVRFSSRLESMRGRWRVWREKLDTWDPDAGEKWGDPEGAPA